MANGWHTETLGKLLKRIKNEVNLEENVTYKQVTVRLWNKGVILRGQQQGGEIKTKRQFLVQTGQLILSRIDVRNGAIGLCPPELDGAIITNDFWAYEVDNNLICPEYLALYFRTPGFIDDANRTSSGTTHRIRSEEGAFLRIEIPLPPLAEQRRIRARIGALAERVAAAQALRREASGEADALWLSSLNRTFQQQSHIKVLTLEEICIDIIDNLHSTPKYDGNDFPCIRSQDVGWGTMNYSTALRVSCDEFTRRIVRGEPLTNDIVFVREGDVGRCAIVDGSQRFCLGQRVMMLRPNPQFIEPRFLLYQLMSPPVLHQQLLEGMTGTTSKHLNIGKFRKVKFMVPTLEEQKRLVTYMDRLQAQVSTLQVVQAETERELAAMMPSILDRAFKGEL